jgi:hypothetical protein
MPIPSCYYALDFNRDDSRGELLADPEEFNEEGEGDNSHE